MIIIAIARAYVGEITSVFHITLLVSRPTPSEACSGYYFFRYFRKSAI